MSYPCNDPIILHNPPPPLPPSSSYLPDTFYFARCFWRYMGNQDEYDVIFISPRGMPGLGVSLWLLSPLLYTVPPSPTASLSTLRCGRRIRPITANNSDQNHLHKHHIPMFTRLVHMMQLSVLQGSYSTTEDVPASQRCSVI